jgi:hypothetical protein
VISKMNTIPQTYSAMTDLIRREQPGLVVCHIMELGGMFSAFEHRIPYATVSPTPMNWLSVASPGHFGYKVMPVWIRRWQARMLRLLMNLAHKYQVQSYCRKRQIPNFVTRIDDAYERACINMAFWSERLSPDATDDPPNYKKCGFVRDEHIKEWADVPEAIDALFNRNRKPVVVGMGSTASLHLWRGSSTSWMVLWEQTNAAVLGEGMRRRRMENILSRGIHGGYSRIDEIVHGRFRILPVTASAAQAG